MADYTPKDEDDDDTQGHGRVYAAAIEDDDDTQGHVRLHSAATEDDDVEGHQRRV